MKMFARERQVYSVKSVSPVKAVASCAVEKDSTSTRQQIQLHEKQSCPKNQPLLLNIL